MRMMMTLLICAPFSLRKAQNSKYQESDPCKFITRNEVEKIGPKTDKRQIRYLIWHLEEWEEGEDGSGNRWLIYVSFFIFIFIPFSFSLHLLRSQSFFVSHQNDDLETETERHSQVVKYCHRHGITYRQQCIRSCHLLIVRKNILHVRSSSGSQFIRRRWVEGVNLWTLYVM